MTISDRRNFIKTTTALVATPVLAKSIPLVLAKSNLTRAEQNPYSLRSGAMPVSYVPRRGYADGPYGQIHFRDTEEGIPLVMCHQAPQTSKQFTNVYWLLKQLGIRAIGVDLAGFGESDPTPFVPTIEDWAAIVPAVLDHLEIKSAHVLGHHTGAMVATEAALQFPGRVNKLVLNGPLPITEEQRLQYLEFVREKEIDFIYRSDGSHLQESFLVRRKMFGDDADPKTITRYVTEKFEGYAPFWIGHHAAFIYDHGAALSRIKHPTLILTNTGDEIYKHAKLAREMRPDFFYRELVGGGVDIVDQMSYPWAKEVADFLRLS